MTFSDDLTPEEELEEESPEYPEAFGIPLTPSVSGSAIALLGVGVAGYLWVNFLQPAQERYNNLLVQREQLQATIQQQPSFDQQIQTLERQIQTLQARQQQVLNLLSNEESLNTLLFDIEQIIQTANQETVAPENSQLQLESFQPVSVNPEIVNDGSFGAAVNGKIQRKTYSLEVVGTFTQTQLLIRNIERLQPLLLVQDFSTEITEQQQGEFSREENRFVVTQTPQLRSSFQLVAILPVNSDN